MNDSPSPKEETYQDYANEVESYAESAVERLEDEPTSAAHGVVDEVIAGANRVHSTAYALNTLQHTTQNPDNPDHCPAWTTYVDDDEDDIVWRDYVTEMAYTAFYSDVMELVQKIQDADKDEQPVHVQ